MALADLPPNAAAQEKQEFARWLDGAIAQLRTAEIDETYDNLAAILTSRAYTSLSSEEEGYPSPSAFMAMAPEARKTRLSTLMRSADKLEEGMIAFLDNLAEEDAESALALIGDLSRGASADFKARLSAVVEHANRVKLEEEQAKKRPDFSELKTPASQLRKMKSPPLVPDLIAEAMMPTPKRPSGDPRDRPEDAIKNADRIMRKLVGGEEAGG